MSARAHQDARPAVACSSLTRLGWCVLLLVAPLGATLLMPSWQPLPYAAALAIGLLLALGLAMWSAPRSLHGVRGEWVLPRSAHALAISTVGARLSAVDGAPPLDLLAWHPSKGKTEVAARVPGLEAVGPGQAPATRITWVTSFPKRGLHRLPSLSVRTSQPFGLVSTIIPIGPGTEILVFPALGQIRRAFELEMRRWMESQPLTALLGNDELSHLRPYRPGDRPHSVHWKASARLDELLVMERHTAGSRKLSLVVDTCSGAQAWKMERLISVAATLVEHFCAKGWSLTLYGLFAPGGVHASKEGMLEALALAEMQSGEIRDLIPEHEATIVLSQHPMAETPANAIVLTLAACEDLIALPPRVH